MEWVRENWVFILIFIFFVAMHSFGGCMGGHGKHGEEEGHSHEGRTGEEAAEKKEKKGGHGCC